MRPLTGCYVALESIISKNPHVKNAIMFGRERLSNGIFIEPSSYEEAERLGVEKFRNLIWYVTVCFFFGCHPLFY